MISIRQVMRVNGGRMVSLLAAIALAGASLAPAQAPAPANSPFLPNNGPAPSDSGETIELAGVSTVGDRTDLIFHDKISKKNRWIRLGSTADGITAVKYDARLEQAVVRMNGVEKVLTLRKGTGPLNAPMPPAPAVVATPAPAPVPANAPTGALGPANPAGGTASPPATPEAIAKQETEARMLVSDLLEIGMAQRKAYEEAQRKAAEANGAATGAPPPAAPAMPAATAPVAPGQSPLPAGAQPLPAPSPAPTPAQN